jgi:hypothetical protein
MTVKSCAVWCSGTCGSERPRPGFPPEEYFPKFSERAYSDGGEYREMSPVYPGGSEALSPRDEPPSQGRPAGGEAEIPGLWIEDSS